MRLGELWGRVIDRVRPGNVGPDTEHRNYMMDRGYTAAGVAMDDPESRYLQGAWDRYHEGAEPQDEADREQFARWDQERPSSEVVAAMEDILTDREGVTGTDQAEEQRDRLIDQAADRFPEYSCLEKTQERIEEEARDTGRQEGPGYTEPPVTWEGYRPELSEYEKDHYWDTPDHEVMYQGGPSTEEMSDEEINAMALPFEEAEPPENDPDERAGQDGYDPQDDTWSYDDRTTAERDRDQAAGEAVAARHEADVRDAAEFETYYGGPPTPAAEPAEVATAEPAEAEAAG
jgi:hypothetical protein